MSTGSSSHKHTISILYTSERERVIQFIEKCASMYNPPQLCAPRGRPGRPLAYLTASCKKNIILTACSGALQQLEPPQPLTYGTFMPIWKGFVPLSESYETQIRRMCDTIGVAQAADPAHWQVFADGILLDTASKSVEELNLTLSLSVLRRQSLLLEKGLILNSAKIKVLGIHSSRGHAYL